MREFPISETTRIKLKAMVFPAFAAAEFIRLELHLQELEPFVVALVSVQFSVRGRLSIPQTAAVSYDHEVTLVNDLFNFVHFEFGNL